VNDELSNYLRARNASVPQSQPADPRQRLNNAGGYSFVLDDDARFRRFPLLGTDAPTFYAQQADLTKANATFVENYVREHGVQAVTTIVELSIAGRAPRQQPGLFALAMAMTFGDVQTRKMSADALPDVARTASSLLTFTSYLDQLRSWGRLPKAAVAGWLDEKPLRDLVYQLVKYRNRDGWTTRDLLRSAHPVPAVDDVDRRALYDWVVGRDYRGQSPDLELIEGLQLAQKVDDGKHLAQVIRRYRLTHEMLPTQLLNDRAVWEALLEVGVPLTALTRQLPRLTRLGMLTGNGDVTRHVVGRLTDAAALRNARVHPIKLLVAQRTYAQGGSDGRSTWTPARRVVDALDAAFYAAYSTVTPSNQRLLPALDVSGSMDSKVLGSNGKPGVLSAREASAALALVQLSVEPNCHDLLGFTSTSAGRWRSGDDNAITPLNVSPRQRLDDVIRTISALKFGATDCALPILYALREKLEVDAFVIYTDNESWSGPVHVHQALRRYRNETGIDAKLIVVALSATEFSVADPSDAGSLNCVGFDGALPQVISSFAESGLR
jgi:60 kDa SS-A/Ro ribonucleoprotein